MEAESGSEVLDARQRANVYEHVRFSLEKAAQERFEHLLLYAQGTEHHKQLAKQHSESLAKDRARLEEMSRDL